MNSQLTQLIECDLASPNLPKNLTHIAIPVTKTDEGKFKAATPKSLLTLIEKSGAISITEELDKAGDKFAAKAGEIWEVPLLIKGSTLTRIFLVGVGSGDENDLRKAGIGIGRRVRGEAAKVLSLCPTNKKNVITHSVAFALSTYLWNVKTVSKPLFPTLLLSDVFADEIAHAKILVEATWMARDLIHTPSNMKSPAAIAERARILAKRAPLKVSVRSGRELAEFGGLRAVGNSSKEHPPRFVEVTYSPKGRSVPHVVFVGKGITFDTGGVSLKRPYDLMTAMKSDMAGSATVLMATYAAAQLGLKVKVTALLMLAENALSGTAQRPSDVITHFGGTTVEVINTDAEGRLVLADGLAYADKKLNPDFLIDVATLTGAATLGLSRFYGAMYTRNFTLAKRFHEIGNFIGDRVWHMPLIDDYQNSLESDVADFNHSGDKGKFQAGSVTAALFLEKFVGDRNWVHFDIAGPARSDADVGENPKGGTGFGVRLLTEWLASL